MPKHRLTQWQRVELRKLWDEMVKTARRYGDRIKKRNGEKQCIRIKRLPKWIKYKNWITQFPSELKPHHVAYMLYYDVALPECKRVVVCHRCCDVNPQKKSRRNTGAPCIEPTHLDLRSQIHNLGQEECHRRIREYALDPNNKKDPSIKTTGTIYVSDTIKPGWKDKFKCGHKPCCFGCFGEIKVVIIRSK